MPLLTSRERGIRMGITLAALLAFGFLVLKNIFPGIVSLRCGFKALTGLPCLLCGGTRAACAALRGEFFQSIYLNALSLPLLCAMFLCAAISAIELTLDRPLTHWPSSSWFFKKWPLACLLLLTFWSLHLASALRTPKPELLNLNNVMASRIRTWIAR